MHIAGMPVNGAPVRRWLLMRMHCAVIDPQCQSGNAGAMMDVLIGWT